MSEILKKILPVLVVGGSCLWLLIMIKPPKKYLEETIEVG